MNARLAKQARMQRVQRDDLPRRVASIMASTAALDEACALFERASREALGLLDLAVLANDAMRPAASRTRIVIPLQFAGREVGAIVSTFSAPPDDADLAALEMCALHVAARLVDAERRREVDRYERLATIDALTGVANRRAFDESLAREWARALRVREPLAVLMIDVDFFKGFNDAYGHTAGDTCLKRVARAAAASLARPGDLFARYGGEEFAAILPNTTLSGAVSVAEAMRAAVASITIAHQGSTLERVSISVGCAAEVPQAGDDVSTLLEAADEAVYAAKAEGRNRVHAAGYEAHGEPIAPRFILRGNLPVARTRFVGRAADLDALLHSLDNARLVTLSGPGGVGKTRLALETAARWIERGGNAWFVDLSTARPHDELLPIAAAALRGHLPYCRSAAELSAHLRARRALLVLDNCEHLLDDASFFVEELLAQPGDLRIVATSREALRVEGEIVHRVAPLDFGDASELLRDRAASAGAEVQDVSEDALRSIVSRLDGIPLAIELAASRLTTMTPRELAAELSTRLGTLHAASRRAPSRQKTLQATFDWSYRLLEERDRIVFRRLAIFVGGIAPDAAREVCSSEGISGDDVSTALASLLGKSLLVRAESGDATRFTMLETTHEFAAQLLDESAERAPLAERHARCFGAFVRRARELRSAMPTTPWLRMVSDERSNLRSALAWTLAHHPSDAAEMIEGLCDWYYDRGTLYAVEHADAFRRALASDASRDERLAMALRIAIASITRRIDAPGARALADEAAAFYERLGDVRLRAMQMRVSAFTQFAVDGRIDPEREAHIAGLAERLVEAGETTLAADLFNNLGILRTQLLDDARLPDALRAFDRSIELLERRGDDDRCGLPNGNSGDIAFYLGDTHAAMARARRAISILERTEETWLAGLQHLNLGHFAMWAGEHDLARASLHRAFDGLQAHHESMGAVSVFDKMAQLARLTGQYERAARLLGFTDAAFARAGLGRQRREARFIEQMRADLQARLGDRYDELHADGARLTRELAREEALAV